METKQAFQELHLNIKHQNIRVDKFGSVGYEIDKGKYVLALIIKLPKELIKNKK